MFMSSNRPRGGAERKIRSDLLGVWVATRLASTAHLDVEGGETSLLGEGSWSLWMSSV